MKSIDESSLASIWQYIEEQLELNQAPYTDLNATFEFIIDGKSNDVYQLHFQDGDAAVYYKSKKEPDCKLKMKLKYFKRLLLGELNSTTAFMTGRVKITGNIMLALKLETMLKEYTFPS